MMRLYTLPFFLLLLSPVQGLTQLVINELMADNESAVLDPDYGQFVDWLELYNTSESWLLLNGWTLQVDTQATWTIPAGTRISGKGHLVIWADRKSIGFHAPFALPKEGGTLILRDENGREQDRITYPSLGVNRVYGRSPDGEAPWAFLDSLSLGTSNPHVGFVGIAPAPVPSTPGGFYSGSLSLSLHSPVPGAEIRYTTDGSPPHAESPLFPSSLVVSQTFVLKARVYAPGHVPSESWTQTYFINEPERDLPVISMSTDPPNLWDDRRGIYVTGTNGIKGNGPASDPPRNWNRDWERPVWMEYFQSDSLVFAQGAGIKIFGGWSRSHGQKSLSVFARKQYGRGSFRHAFFAQKPIQKFESLVLRNSGNDWSGSGGIMFRDAFLQALVAGQLDLDIQAYTPAVMFLNGEYWGIHNIREKLNDRYIESNHGVSPQAVDLLEGFATPKTGDARDYQALVQFLENNSFSQKASYQRLADWIDIPEYIHYVITQVYIDNTDWPGNNIKFWRPRHPDGKWRWMLFDTDFGFSIWGQSPSANTLAFALDPNGPGWPNPPWATLLFRKLSQNPDFREQFVRTFEAQLNTRFQPVRVIGILDSLADQIRPEMARHYQRWGGGSVSSWQGKLSGMKSYAQARPDFVRDHLRRQFNLQNPVPFRLLPPPAYQGRVFLNQVPVDDLVDGSTFPNYPPYLEARAEPGFRFVNWEISGDSSLSLVAAGSRWRYWDQGGLPQTTWTDPMYDDQSWAEGAAELGYGDGDEATQVSDGNTGSGKQITTYFRHRFQVNDPAELYQLVLSMKRDDGIVVYLNGQEMLRNNLPEGPLSPQTLALQVISGSDESLWQSQVLPTAALLPGENVLAVAIHQVNNGSSDISFDLSLNALMAADSAALIPARRFSWAPKPNALIQARFEPDPGLNGPSLSGIYLNEVMSANQAYEPDEYGEFDDWVEVYNANEYAVDLGGLYLSDDPALPQKWRIPLGQPHLTTLAAGAYMRLWADGQPEQGPLHLNFRLSAKGEWLLLSEHAKGLLDSAWVASSQPNYSWARLPDATGPWQAVAPHQTTPARSNQVQNEMPVFVSSPTLEAEPLRTYQYEVITHDPNNERVYIQAECLPSWLSLEDRGNGRAYLTGYAHEGVQGHYQVQLQARDGHPLSESWQSFALWVPSPLEARLAQNPAGILFPNPSSGLVQYVQALPSGESLQLEVFDVQGRRLQVQEIKAVGERAYGTLDMRPYSPGFYWVRVSQQGQVLDRYKLVKRQE